MKKYTALLLSLSSIMIFSIHIMFFIAAMQIDFLKWSEFLDIFNFSYLYVLLLIIFLATLFIIFKESYLDIKSKQKIS